MTKKTKDKVKTPAKSKTAPEPIVSRPKRPEGKPTKYKPEYCQLLIDHMSSGLSYESFSGVVRCCKDTLYEWEKRFPEYADSKKEAVGLCQLWWEKEGIAGLFTSFQGSSMNSSVWIFNMKNRFKWRDRQPEEVEQPAQININEPVDYAELIRIAKGIK